MNAVEPLAATDFEALFEHSSEPLFVLHAELPYPVVAVNQAFLAVTMTRRDAVLGSGLFEIFPPNPGDPASNNLPDVQAGLERVCQTGRAEHFPPYRYDIPRPPESGGGFEERFWQMRVNPASPDDAGLPRLLLGRTEDVTARVRAEAEMLDARTRLEATLASAEIGTWIWDPEKNQVYADRNLARFFRVSDDDARGGPLDRYLSAIHPDDRERVNEAIGAAVRNGSTYEVEYRLVHPDRPERWVNARGWAERDESGNVRRFPGVLLDVTARRQAEAALHENSERLRMAIESANLGTWDYFPATGELIWSDLCRAMFGAPPGAPITFPLFLAALHADDRQRTQETMLRAFHPQSGGYFEVDFRAVGFGDSVERWIALMGRAFFDQEGKVERFIGTALDITTRKRAEQATIRRSEQLQSLAAASTRLNAAHDVRSVLGIVAGEARDLIGARHAVTSTTSTGPSSASAPPALTVVSPGDQELPSGAARLPGLSAPLLGHGGQPIGVIELLDKLVGAFTPDDSAVLTQLAQIAAGAIENARLYEELRANDKHKDAFLAMLAHELRNPLAAIRNAVALGSHGADAADVTWSLEVIHRQTGQLNRLIDDLLDVSRITQGMVQLRKELLDVAEVLRRAVDAVRGLIGERRHSLDLVLPADALSLEGDPVRMEQIFVNLLTNAAKYTDHGGKISLQAARENGHVVVKVRDNGVGIPPDKLPQMFELFAQGNRSLARTEGGLGIGLTVVRSLTHLHGGSVHATSEGPGQGSEFVVRLPAAAAPPAPDSAAVSDPAAAAEKPPAVRVLVVDDNVDSARAAAKILARKGYDVQVAYDGPSAVETALMHQPAFVFLDIGLPGMNGYEVATRLRQDPGLKEAMFVAVSGYGEESDRRRSREAGFDQHLVKPVDPIHLLALMKG